MTGFGTGRASDARRSFVVEVRSVNHKYCDVKTRLPRELAGLEALLQSVIRRRVARGRVEVSLEVGLAPGVQPELRLNLDLARAYHRALQSIGEATGLEEAPSLALIAAMPGVLEGPERDGDLTEATQTVTRALDEALAGLDEMRTREGSALHTELARLLGAIAEHVAEIQREIPEVARLKKAKLEQRLTDLLDDQAIDPVRLAQEVAILVDRSDVTEEIARLSSHTDQFSKLLHDREPVGRKLDFLLQEMHRETNTIGSKSPSTQIAHLVVDLKSSIERMREQVQNVE